jgi:hypothetical protein
MIVLAKGPYLALLILALVAGACASRVPVLDYDALEHPPSPEVIEIWESHREVLVRAIKDKKFTIQEFERALRFFEEQTGLPAHPSATRYGLLPNDRTRDDLRAWDDWFRDNGAGLEAADL